MNLTLTPEQRSQLVDALCDYRHAHWGDGPTEDAIRYGRVGYVEFTDPALLSACEAYELNICSSIELWKAAAKAEEDQCAAEDHYDNEREERMRGHDLVGERLDALEDAARCVVENEGTGLLAAAVQDLAKLLEGEG